MVRQVSSRLAVEHKKLCEVPNSPLLESNGTSAERPSVVVTHVGISLTVFSPQCIWVHIVDDPLEMRPSLGCVVTATPLPFAPYVSESVLLEAPTVAAALQQDGETAGASVTAPQTAFARSLVLKLTKRYREVKERGVMFTVCCGLSGPLEADLLGTSVGGPTSTNLEFAASVFREIKSLVDRELAV